MAQNQLFDYDVVIVGAGVCGIYQIKRLVDMGLKATVIEAEDDLGGTWYMNRYPGARFDSESYTYGYSFSKELLAEWHWKEKFSSQPENLRYLNYVADKFDLRRHMQFGCKVESAKFNENLNSWDLKLSDGRSVATRFLIMGIGLLAAPTLPRYEGMELFKGQSFHTYYWPHEGVDLKHKRVAVIGTGATGVQVIGAIAPLVKQLTVFQRRPNWTAPLNNSEISENEMNAIRSRYDDIFEACRRSPGGFEHEPDRRGFYEVSKAERLKLWDKLYDEPGFGIWLQNFREIFTDETANAEISEYIANRIRQRVKDPLVAEKLIPKDHGFGVQRLPLETRYLEAYNQDNVRLVDISQEPISAINQKGLCTSEECFEFDIIVYATGFDAITGSFDRMHIEGVEGEKLRDKWKEGPSTYLGMLINGFPNLLMPAGPQSGSASTNYPRGIENGVNWVTELLAFMKKNAFERVEATEDAEKKWTAHVTKMYSTMLMRKAKGWFTGYNSNVAGHEAGRTRYFVYNGGTPKYVSTITNVAENDYEGLTLTRSSAGFSEDSPKHSSIQS